MNAAVRACGPFEFLRASYDGVCDVVVFETRRDAEIEIPDIALRIDGDRLVVESAPFEKIVVCDRANVRSNESVDLKIRQRRNGNAALTGSNRRVGKVCDVAPAPAASPVVPI